MTKYKHMDLSQRITIEKGLKEAKSFKAIARELERDCKTISNDVRNHRIFKQTGAYGLSFNDCANRFGCPQTGICGKDKCKKRCCFCGLCSKSCPDYKREFCTRLAKPPYVCNGCNLKQKCTLEKAVYSASSAQKEYETVRSEAQSGIVINKEEAERLDKIISPLVRKGQSIHHVFINHGDEIMFSEKTIYNYYDKGVFSTDNISLPRKVRYRPRKSRHDAFKRDKSCRIGRTYADFLEFMAKNPDTPIVEMDSVEGVKGGHVLRTIHFIDSRFMLMYKCDATTAKSTEDVIELLYSRLGHNVFIKLFPVILADNGSEFSAPKTIEFNRDGEGRTRLFYCESNCSFQKGAIENNHELIRRIVPKGRSFNPYSQDAINIMMNHINSYGRKSLNDHTPYAVFRLVYGEEVLNKLNAVLIPADDVTLLPSLLKNLEK